MSIVNKENVTLAKGVVNFFLSLRREARASRAETRADRRLEITEERLEIQQSKVAAKAKKRFGREIK